MSSRLQWRRTSRLTQLQTVTSFLEPLPCLNQTRRALTTIKQPQSNQLSSRNGSPKPTFYRCDYLFSPKHDCGGYHQTAKTIIGQGLHSVRSEVYLSHLNSRSLKMLAAPHPQALTLTHIHTRTHFPPLPEGWPQHWSYSARGLYGYAAGLVVGPCGKVGGPGAVLCSASWNEWAGRNCLFPRRPLVCQSHARTLAHSFIHPCAYAACCCCTLLPYVHYKGIVSAHKQAQPTVHSASQCTLQV